HTGNCAVTTVDGTFVPYNGDRDQAAIDRPKDVSFLIDCMDRLNKGGDSRFLGKFDLEHIGVAGHSFGGFTAGAVADTDERVDAIAPMAYVGDDRVNYTCPVMLLIATEDDTIGAEGNAQMRTYYDESKGYRYQVEFVNAGHYSFTEMYQLNPAFGDGVGSGTRITNEEAIDYIGMDKAFRLTNTYTTAFFGRFVKGMDGYEAYMTKNHDEDELIVKHGAAEGM
ncbi:MAG: hypothetical protein GY851_14750, partial [bacterium]|nr:hypothetical protein [bacterium]